MPDVSKKIIKSHDGLDLYYETHAIETDKPALFFLHGVGGDLDGWGFVQNALLDKGFSTIAMDLRGHGNSSHPKGPESYQMHHLLKDVADILDAEKLNRVILIGHSFGAGVAQSFAAAYPEKIDKLVIISPIFTRPWYLRRNSARSLANYLSILLAKISPKPFGPWHSSYPAGKFHKDYEWMGLARTIFHNSLKSYLLTSKEIIGLDSESTLSQIQAPTLVIAGEQDSIFPIAVTKKLQKKIPNSKLEVISGANHVLILNNPGEVVDLINNFL